MAGKTGKFGPIGIVPEFGAAVNTSSTNRGVDRYDPDHPGDYAVDRFYCSRKDSKGTEKMIQVWLPSGFHALVTKLVADSRTKYEYNGDLLRDAVAHRLHWLEKFLGDPDYAEMSKDYVIAEGLRADMEMMNGWEGAIESFKEAMTQAVRLRAWPQLATQLEKLEEFAQGKPAVIYDAADRLAYEYQRELTRGQG